MRRTTKKLSGPQKDRFLRQWLASEPGLEREAIERLVRRGADAITSVRVRRLRWGHLKASAVVVRQTGGATVTVGPAPSATHSPSTPSPSTPPAATTSPKSGATAKTRGKKAGVQAVAAPATPVASAPPPASAAPFDPYVVALVPVMQREGADSLVAKLTAIGDTDKLRRIARAQQIALPAEMKSDAVDVATLAAAITQGVAKRIADRKAAAR
jgi:hypothetical protein